MSDSDDDLETFEMALLPNDQATAAEVEAQIEKVPPRPIFGKGVVIYLIAMVMNSVMQATAKLVLQDVDLFVAVGIRMAVTALLSTAIMRHRGIEHSFWGPPQLRLLLFSRGILGFFNLSLSFYALQWLSLPDQASLGFLTPLVTIIIAALCLHERLLWQQVVCSFISLAGVLLIARPPALFGGSTLEVDLHHSVAVIACLTSVVGTGGVMVLLRTLKTANPMASVGNYAVMSTIGSVAAVLVLPTAGPRKYPTDLRAWSLIFAMGTFGFVLQYMQSWAFQLEEATVLVNFRYTQLIWATLCEFILWHDWPDAWSLLGSAIVLTSVLYSASLNNRK